MIDTFVVIDLNIADIKILILNQNCNETVSIMKANSICFTTDAEDLVGSAMYIPYIFIYNCEYKI